MCICIISVCFENSSIDLPLMEYKASVDLLEGGGKGSSFGKMCVTCAVPRETCAASWAFLCSQYGSGTGVEPIAPIGSGVLFPRRAFVVSCGMRNNGLNRM